MVHELSQYDFELPDVDDWLAGDDRTLEFVVVDGDGNAVDIETATVSWFLHNRPYETAAGDAVLDGSDSGVEIVTDSRVDTSQGEFEVRIDGSASADLWGVYHQRPEVTAADGSVASWIGTVAITA